MLPGFIAFLNMATCPPPQTGLKEKTAANAEAMAACHTCDSCQSQALTQPFQGLWTQDMPVSTCMEGSAGNLWKRPGRLGGVRTSVRLEFFQGAAACGPACLSVVSPHYMEHTSLPTPGRCQLPVFDLFWDYLAPTTADIFFWFLTNQHQPHESISHVWLSEPFPV